jgi:hypothetical protein
MTETSKNVRLFERVSKGIPEIAFLIAEEISVCSRENLLPPPWAGMGEKVPHPVVKKKDRKVTV